jgi:hypothetical protein
MKPFLKRILRKVKIKEKLYFPMRYKKGFEKKHF